ERNFSLVENSGISNAEFLSDVFRNKNISLLRVPLPRGKLIDLFVGKRNHYFFCAVGCADLQLMDIPLCVDETQIHNTHIPSYSFDILQIPEGKRIVIAIREKNCILVTTLQKVIRIIPGNVILTAVMFEPVH